MKYSKELIFLRRRPSFCLWILGGNCCCLRDLSGPDSSNVILGTEWPHPYSLGVEMTTPHSFRIELSVPNRTLCSLVSQSPKRVNPMSSHLRENFFFFLIYFLSLIFIVCIREGEC